MSRVCAGIDFDTEQDWTSLYAAAGLEDLQTTSGPFAMMTPTGSCATKARSERPTSSATRSRARPSCASWRG
jgi:hypothetical protein